MTSLLDREVTYGAFGAENNGGFMPERQVPWVIGILFAIVMTGAVAFIGYMQDRIATGYLLINMLTEKVARMEEREKTGDVIRISMDNRIANLERDRSYPR